MPATTDTTSRTGHRAYLRSRPSHRSAAAAAPEGPGFLSPPGPPAEGGCAAVARSSSPVRTLTSAGWWPQAVIYRICPHRYGDLRGVISRIPYLAALGIDAVCLSPFQARVG